MMGVWKHAPLLAVLLLGLASRGDAATTSSFRRSAGGPRIRLRAPLITQRAVSAAGCVPAARDGAAVVVGAMPCAIAPSQSRPRRCR